MTTTESFKIRNTSRDPIQVGRAGQPMVTVPPGETVELDAVAVGGPVGEIVADACRHRHIEPADAKTRKAIDKIIADRTKPATAEPTDTADGGDDEESTS